MVSFVRLLGEPLVQLEDNQNGGEHDQQCAL